jgi:uncharacterized membrane protein
MGSFNLIDFIHQLFTVVYIGGMIFMDLILMPSLKILDPPQQGKILSIVAKKFTMTAWLSVLVLLITGYLKTPDGMLLNPSAGYGLILTIKHLLFLLMIIFGLVITLAIAPKLQKLAPQAGEKPSAEFLKNQKAVALLSGSNMILGVGILVLVYLL